MINRSWIGVFLVVLLCGCETNQNKSPKRSDTNTFNQFTSALESSPDSVLNLLNSKECCENLDILQILQLKVQALLATNKLPEALVYLEEVKAMGLGNDSVTLATRHKAAIALYRSGDYQGFIKALKELLILFEEAGNEYSVSKTLSNISGGFHELQEFDSSLHYQQLALRVAQRLGDSGLIERQTLEMIPVFLETGRIDTAEQMLLKLVYRKDRSKLDRLIDLINYGTVFNKRQDYAKSKEVYLDAIVLAEDIGDSMDIAHVLNNIAYADYHLGNYKDAFIMLDSVNDIYSSLHQLDYAANINELELKFMDLEKDAELAELASQTEADRTFKIWLSVVSFLVVSILGSLFVSNRNRLKNLKRIREEEHLRFQKEKELAALHSSLQALEEERKRVAMDLHDGIGVLASAARLRVSQVNKRIDDATLNKILNETDEVLNTITGDVRRIAHNIMPATLSKLGLKTAIEELLEKSPHSMDIEFKLKLEEVRLPQAKPHDITLYRICQELVNNALKHSQSTLVEISLTQKGNLVTLRYDDNGVGLSDTNGTGSGLDAMRSRIESFGGRMFVDKSSKTGTHIYFEVSNG